MGALNKYFWTSSCGRALFVAAPFGYGPRVAAETMAASLGLRIGKWKLNGSGRANPESVKLLLNFGVDYPVNVSDSTYRVWVDCLMWLRRALPPAVENYELLLAESFFETRDIFQKLPTLRQISPLLNSATNSDNKKGPPTLNQGATPRGHILVSFGGVETPFTLDIHRFLLPTLVLDALLKVLRERNDPRNIVCCLPNHLRERLSRIPRFANVRFQSPDHRSFLRLLEGASLYVVQPGLYGPFEGFERRIPTAFCTPFSYTQICQARKYQEYGILGNVPLWDELNSEIGILNGQIEAEEPKCFGKLANWLEERVAVRVHDHALKEWAKMTLHDNFLPINLITERAYYARSRRNFSNGFITSFSRILD